MMDKQNKIKEEAARWFLWLHEKGANKTHMDIFLRWQNSNPEHKAAYQEIEAFWEFCDSLSDLPWPTPQEIANDRYDGLHPLPLPIASTVSAGESEPNMSQQLVNNLPSPKRSFSMRYGIAASLMFILGAAALVATQYNVFFDNEMSYQTAKAEQHEYQLDDGSLITLGPTTKVSIAFNDKQRRLVLHSGEAFFKVAKDSARPFVVDTGSGSVQAIGTEFNINKRAQHLTVSVLEGIISFTKPNSHVDSTLQESTGLRLIQGQRLVYDAHSKSAQAQDKVLPRASSWREGKLAYVDEKLSSVIEDVNRYSKDEFVVGDAIVGDLIYTGTVFNDDIGHWTEALVKTFPVRVIKLEGRIVLLSSLKTAS